MSNSKSIKIFLSLGSNQGDRILNLQSAVQEIASKCGHLLNESSIYETAAWGNTNQSAFLNQVIEIQTILSPQSLLKTVLEIEESLGRVRLERWGPRLIDIDILFYGSDSINQENLTVPHPEIQNRNFVLIPLVEIAPNLIHPKFGVSVTQLLYQIDDDLSVQKLSAS